MRIISVKKWRLSELSSHFNVYHKAFIRSYQVFSSFLFLYLLLLRPASSLHLPATTTSSCLMDQLSVYGVHLGLSKQEFIYQLTCDPASSYTGSNAHAL